MRKKYLLRIIFFDIVLAMSVKEHVQDLDKALEEIYRVLKPGGLFWFYSPSSMCPFQGEIKGFPFLVGILIV